ncbi:DUF2913 family protein [Enterobacter ludwigii]|uniref:DUF2913 family protein n=1 Tax=Enterobacter ludwigii TaxID=299767 RepID=UPI00242AA7C3|nr:DUF2913 family protein [Enterobacter ludwigii]WGC20723.1 DUF2913 family protein [Enterobacter ludwigii]
MKKSSTCLSAEQTVADQAHLSWCALVSLHIARHEGTALSPLTTHTFLLSWLASAQKQRRFPRSVAPDIDSLLRLGRSRGAAANLLQRLEYLYESCSGPVRQRSELFRLTSAIEALKSQGWLNAVVTDKEWATAALLEEYANVPALLVRRSELTLNFSEAGVLLNPIEFIATGDDHTISNEFTSQELHYNIEAIPRTGYKIVLTPVPETEISLK